MATKTNYLDSYDIQTDFDVNFDDNLYLLNQKGLDIEDVICLAGGVPCEVITNCKLSIETKPNEIIDVHILTSEYELKRTIDFGTMTIENELMKVKNRRNGLGLYMLLNQVATARAHNFAFMKTYAMGGSTYGFDKNWNGFYSWGRVGYLMEESSYKRFEGWLNNSKSGLKYLHEVLDTNWGKDVWLQTGFDWDGYFDLNDGSASMEILQKYLVERGITKRL